MSRFEIGDGTLELTIPFDRAFAVRGAPEPKAEAEEISRSRSKLRVSRVSFSVHSLTHVDLPWQIDWAQVEEYAETVSETIGRMIEPNELRRRARRLLSQDSMAREIRKARKPRSYPCIIIDLSDRAGELQQYLESDPDDASIMSPFIRPDINYVTAEQLFKALAITGDFLQDTLPSRQDLSGTIVLFRTTWRERFEPPATQRVLGPLFEAWHAILTYPYLTDDAVRLLDSRNVAGVASDSVGLENPLNFVDPSHHFLSYIRRLGYSRLLRPWPIMHLVFLSNRRLIINNLANLERISFPPSKSRTGRLHLVPFDFETYDAMMLRVFLELDV